MRYNYFAYWVLIFGLHFCGAFAWHIKIKLQLRFVFICHFNILLLRHNYVIYLFRGVLFWWLIITLNYGNCSSLWIMSGRYFTKWSFFSMGITFLAYCFLIMLIFLIMFESNMKIMLQSGYIRVHQSNEFFKTS